MKELSLAPTHIIGFFLPGFIFLAMVFCSYTGWDIEAIINVLKEFESIGAAFLIVVTSFITGLIIDAVRNGVLEEHALDRTQKKRYLKKVKTVGAPEGFVENDGEINWDFFFDHDKDKIATLYSRYFNYYLFDINSVTSLVFAFPVMMFFMICSNSFHYAPLVLTPVVCYILLKDALDLRWELYLHTNKPINEQKSSA